MQNHETLASTGFRLPRVRDIMTPDPFTLYVEDNLKVLEELMQWRNIRHVPVIDQDGDLAGLVTHRDFLALAVSELAEIRKSEVDRLYKGIQVGKIMRSKVTSVSPETSLKVAAEIMVKHKFGCLPVVEGQKLVGIITEADFVKIFFEWDASFNEKKYFDHKASSI